MLLQKDYVSTTKTCRMRGEYPCLPCLVLEKRFFYRHRWENLEKLMQPMSRSGCTKDSTYQCDYDFMPWVKFPDEVSKNAREGRLRLSARLNSPKECNFGKKMLGDQRVSQLPHQSDRVGMAISLEAMSQQQRDAIRAAASSDGLTAEQFVTLANEAAVHQARSGWTQPPIDDKDPLTNLHSCSSHLHVLPAIRRSYSLPVWKAPPNVWTGAWNPGESAVSIVIKLQQ